MFSFSRLESVCGQRAGLCFTHGALAGSPNTMKIVNRQPEKTADASGARGTAFRELRKLLLFVTILAVVLYVAIGMVVDAVVARISFETEARLFGGLGFSRIGDKSDDRLVRVQTILDRLTADSRIPPLRYRLILIDNSAPNAFAFPGGTIGVTSGLLDALEDDIEVAFVVGHELGHFHGRDHLRGMGRAVGVGVVYAVLFGGEMGGNTLGSVFQLALDRGYSRAQEERADRFGVELVRRVYGETAGVDRLFQILRTHEKLPEWAYMFATHPSPRDRIRALERYAELARESR